MMEGSVTPSAGSRYVGTSVSSEDDLLDIRHTGTTSPKANVDQSIRNPSLDEDDNSTGAGGFGIFSADEIPGLGQYDDFHTIDWQRDIARDRMRHRHIVKKKKLQFRKNSPERPQHTQRTFLLSPPRWMQFQLKENSC